MDGDKSEVIKEDDTMNADELWKQFQKEKGIDSAAYEAWAFGDAPDKLADLVAKGIKVATASLYYWYAEGEECLPKIGDYSVVLDSNEKAVCIIQTTRVSIVPFCDVTAEHARKEGEGDLSLAYWRKVHKEFFSEELQRESKEFSEKMEVVCEEFELVFSSKE